MVSSAKNKAAKYIFINGYGYDKTEFEEDVWDDILVWLHNPFDEAKVTFHKRNGGSIIFFTRNLCSVEYVFEREAISAEEYEDYSEIN